MAALTYGTWTQLADMPAARSKHAVVAVNGKLYVIGGTPDGQDSTAATTVFAYDPATNAWATMAPLPVKLNGPSTGVIGNTIYVAGGTLSNSGGSSALYAYDTTTDTWATRSPLPVVRINNPAGDAVINGKFYVVCCASTTTSYRYDPTTDSWSTVAPNPGVRSAGGLGVLGDKIYYTGGLITGLSGLRPETICYDPTTDAWTTKAPMSTGMNGRSAISIHGILHMVAPPSAYTSTFAYDPATNAWTTIGRVLPQGRQTPAGAAIGNTMYLAGGYSPSLGSNQKSLFALSATAPPPVTSTTRAGATLPLQLRHPAGGYAPFESRVVTGTPSALTLTAPTLGPSTQQPAAFTSGTTMGLALDLPPGSPRYPKPAQLEILDTVLSRAPTAVVVRVSGVSPGAEMTFSIDGVEVLTAQADSSGTLSPISLAVDDTHNAGEHTVTVDAGSFSQAATFTLEADPPVPLRTRGPDAAPVYIAEALQPTGVRKWVLQDLMPGGLGSYVMPISPTTSDAPLVRRTFQTRRSTAPNGKHHLYESGPEPLTWTLRGYCPDKAMHDQLLAYGALNWRFYVIDHRNRAWKVIFTAVNLTPRKRQQQDGVFNDWASDYDISVLVYDDNWKAPQ